MSSAQRRGLGAHTPGYIILHRGRHVPVEQPSAAACTPAAPPSGRWRGRGEEHMPMQAKYRCGAGMDVEPDADTVHHQA
jgi:hypothetical protein